MLVIFCTQLSAVVVQVNKLKLCRQNIEQISCAQAPSVFILTTSLPVCVCVCVCARARSSVILTSFSGIKLEGPSYTDLGTS